MRCRCGNAGEWVARVRPGGRTQRWIYAAVLSMLPSLFVAFRCSDQGVTCECLREICRGDNIFFWIIDNLYCIIIHRPTCYEMGLRGLRMSQLRNEWMRKMDKFLRRNSDC